MVDESSSSAPNSPQTRFFFADPFALLFLLASSPDDTGAENPAAFFLSLRESLPPGLPLPVSKWP